MVECRYLIIRNRQIYNMSDQGAKPLGCGVNPRGFTQEELDQIKNTNDIIIDIIDDLKPNPNSKVDDCLLFPSWFEEYNNTPIMNIKEFSIPQSVCSNDDYMEKIVIILNKYKEILHSGIGTKYETILLKDVDFVCDTLLKALQFGVSGTLDEMDNEIKNLIAYFLDDEFWVSELNRNYAFRGIAYYEQLHSEGSEERYEELKKDDLTFFRAVSSDSTPDTTRMLNCPYSCLPKADAGRFSKKGASCMYLGTTSYVCAKELRFDEKCDHNLYVSAIKFNDEGKKLKILNLALSKYLNIYDKRIDSNNEIRKKIWLSHLKLYPIIIATSFSVNNYAVQESKFEYLLSQSLMRTLKENGIDGVAYASKRDYNSDFSFPHNINLAIIVDDVSQENEYGNLKSYISVTEPIKLTKELIDRISEQKDKLNVKSYVNQKFSNPNDFKSKTHGLGDYILYSRLPYSLFDDYLVNQEFINGNQLQFNNSTAPMH